MPGSLDDQDIEIIDTRDTAIAVLIYPDGQVRLRSDGRSPAEVAAALRELADVYSAQVNNQ